MCRMSSSYSIFGYCIFHLEVSLLISYSVLKRLNIVEYIITCNISFFHSYNYFFRFKISAKPKSFSISPFLIPKCLFFQTSVLSHNTSSILVHLPLLHSSPAASKSSTVSLIPLFERINCLHLSFSLTISPRAPFAPPVLVCLGGMLRPR